MEEQQYVLKWHYHDTTILSSLPELLESKLLTDITLSTEFGQIKAHRLVLATCSQYFLELFKNLPLLQHPVLILKDLDFEDLESLITFMYKGQCKVTAKRLKNLLSIAKFLRIRGLCDMQIPNILAYNHQYYLPSNCRNPINLTSPITSTPHVDKNNDAKNYFNDNNNNYAKTKPSVILDTEKTVNDASNTEKYSPIIIENPSLEKKNNYTNLLENSNNFDNQQTSNEKSIFFSNFYQKPQMIVSTECHICGKQLSNQYNLRVHLETHENTQHACKLCPHISRSRDALRKHVSYKHPIENSSGGEPVAKKRNKSQSSANLFVSQM